MHRVFIAVGLPLFLFTLAGHAASRDELINQIEATYVSGALISADSPIIEMMMGPAKTANPNVAPAEWSSVKVDAAKALTTMLTDRGSAMDTVIRKSLEALSDQELQTLNRILSEPVYQKFQSAMSAPATQKQMFDGMRQAGAHLVETINAVLTAHHLNIPH